MAQVSDYIMIAAVIVMAIIISIVVSRKRAADKIKNNISRQWGNIPEDKYREEDMRTISGYFANLRDNEPDRHYIDDITWNDLEMDSVYKRLNSTLSTAGEEYLYSLLRSPVLDEASLEERNRLIEYFKAEPDDRKKLQYLLAKLGKKRFTGISDYFFAVNSTGFGQSSENPGKSIVGRGLRYKLMSLGLLVSLLIMPLNFPTGLFLAIVFFTTNMTVYYRAKNEMASYLESLSGIVNLVNYSKKIADLDIPGIKEYTGSLKKASDRIKGYSIKSFFQLLYQTQDPYLEYLKVVFLFELIAFESFLKKVRKYREEIRCLFETVGLLDSMIAAASYRESLEYHTVPQMRRSSGSGAASISFLDAYHPLIDDPVTNTLSISKPVLITGSNASGKSTFLKTAAINAIFAQTIATCLAREYKSCFFMIFTSMALRDNLESGESYYISEIKSLKRVLDGLNEELPLLCMIDEVLRGTNTIERIAASSEVLGVFSERNCLCIAATHDIELVSILKDRYDNYHFQEDFRGDDIVFDYKLYPGKSNTRNAIKLLKVMGYSADMVKSAEQRAEAFELNGCWQA